MISKPPKVIPEKVIGYKHDKDAYNHFFTPKDAIIYSLGIGLSKDPMNADDLKFTFELKDDFTVFPTVAATFADVKELFECM